MSLTSDVQLVRSWLEKQAHLPDDFDDHLIERFLAVCEGSLEKTKITMDLFFCLRADAPEFFTDRDPMSPSMQNVFSLIDLLPLPQMTPQGYKVLMYRLADCDPDKFVFNDYVKCFFLVGDTRVRSEQTIPKGDVVIFDMKGYSLKHLTKLNLLSLRKYLQYTQEAHPVKLRQIHVVNISGLLDKTLMVVKPFIKSDVFGMAYGSNTGGSLSLLVNGLMRFSRQIYSFFKISHVNCIVQTQIHFHLPDSKTLYDFIPQDILPKEYGGNAGTVSDIKEMWKSRVEKHGDWLKTNPWLADNSKRSDKKNGLNLMDGSFRALTID